MKQLFRIFSIITFLLLFAGSFVYFKFESRLEKMMSEKKLTEKDILTELEAMYEEWWQEKDYEGAVESRLPYGTQIFVVHVGEMNTDVLFGSLIRNLASYRATYNQDTKSLYFYHESDIPKPDDAIVAIHDVYSLDVLLEENIYSSRGRMKLHFHPIPQHGSPEETGYVIVNEARLFNDSDMMIESDPITGEIRVSFDNQGRTIKTGDYAMFERKLTKEGYTAFSKVVVTNLGLWDAINMKYIVGK